MYHFELEYIQDACLQPHATKSVLQGASSLLPRVMTLQISQVRENIAKTITQNCNQRNMVFSMG